MCSRRLREQKRAEMGTDSVPPGLLDILASLYFDCETVDKVLAFIDKPLKLTFLGGPAQRLLLAWEGDHCIACVCPGLLR